MSSWGSDMRVRGGRTLLATVAAVVVAGPVLAAAPAEAAPPSTVWVEGSTLKFHDTSNVVNRVQITPRGSVYSVLDTSGNLAAQYPCVATDAHLVECPAAGITQYVFDLRGGNDQLLNSSALRGIAYGRAGADYLIGGTGGEAFFGGDDNDRLVGRGGNDRFYGEKGIDWVSYSERTTPVAIRMDNLTGDDGAPGEKDVIWSDVENAEGGKAADLIVGNNLSNWLNGGDGNDRIYGVGGNDRLTPGLGKDSVYGGSGTFNIVDYSSRNQPVRVTLGNGVADEGQASEGDFADANVHGVYGGQAGDSLAGNNSVNYLYGNGGSDTLYGYGSGDVLSGGTGNDFAYGYDGNDSISGGDGVDRLYGMNQNDSIAGGNGNDLLNGGNGIDTGNGGAGTDTCTLIEFKTSCP